jgi:hypothetical protein
LHATNAPRRADEPTKTTGSGENQYARSTVTGRLQPRPAVGYSGTPLAKKLGIGEGSTVALVGAPADFTIPDLPPGTTVRRDQRARTDVTLWFVGSVAELSVRSGQMARRAEANALWICWPKRTSDVHTDVTENAVRAAGLANGLVDFKIAAIDETWSGLRFAVVSDRTKRVRS